MRIGAAGKLGESADPLKIIIKSPQIFVGWRARQGLAKDAPGLEELDHMRQSRSRAAKLAGRSARLGGDISTDVLCCCFGKTHSLLLQPATESIGGHNQSSSLTARITQLGKLDCEGGKIGPYRASKEVFANLQISKVKLKHGILLGARLARWRT